MEDIHEHLVFKYLEDLTPDAAARVVDRFEKRNRRRPLKTDLLMTGEKKAEYEREEAERAERRKREREANRLKRHQQLQDVIEDKRVALKRYKRWKALFTTVLTSSGLISVSSPVLMSVLHSMGVDWGEGSPGITVAAVIVFVAAATGIFSSLYVSEVAKDKHPEDELRKAERDLRDFLTDSVND